MIFYMGHIMFKIIPLLQAFMCRELWNNKAIERVYYVIINMALLVCPLFTMVSGHSSITLKLWREIRLEKHHKITWQKNAQRIKPPETAMAENCSDQEQLSKFEEDTLKDIHKPACANPYLTISRLDTPATGTMGCS